MTLNHSPQTFRIKTSHPQLAPLFSSPPRERGFFIGGWAVSAAWLAQPARRLFGATRLWQDGAMIGTSAHRSLTLAALALLAACGDSGGDAEAKAAATVLTDYYYRAWQAPTPEWNVMKVRIGKDNAVNVDAAVSSEALTKTIMERSRFEQMEIARKACPAVTDKVWQQVGKKQQVGVTLSGSAGHIINALCKRP